VAAEATGKYQSVSPEILERARALARKQRKNEPPDYCDICGGGPAVNDWQFWARVLRWLSRRFIFVFFIQPTHRSAPHRSKLDNCWNGAIRFTTTCATAI